MNTITQEPYTVYSLKPSWSRMLDRAHTIGQTRQIFTNSLATLVEQGDYPRLITSSNENRSFSLDSKHQWSTENWSKGWAVVNDTAKQASLYFAGNDGKTFHQIGLTASSHWDCFECLLQMYSDEMKHEQQVKELQHMIQQTTLNPTINASVSEAAKKINRQIIRGVKLQCTLFTAGGVIRRYHELGSLMTKFGTMMLSSAKSRISLNSSDISRIEMSEKRNHFKGTFFDANGTLQLIVDAV